MLTFDPFNSFKFQAYSGFFLGLHNNPEKVQTHFMLVFVLWRPESQEFQNLHMKVQPMTDLKPLFDAVQRGQSMQAEVERAQREGHVLVQYLVASSSVQPAANCVAFTLSAAWERNNNLKLERNLERKCYAAAPCAGDHLYKKMLDEGYTRLAAQEILDVQRIRRSPLYR